jgi:hypothetical protein
LRLDESDVLNAGLLPRPRLDRLAGWRFKPKRVVWDRLIERRHEGRDLVERLPVSDRGDGEKNTELPIDLELVIVGARTKFVSSNAGGPRRASCGRGMPRAMIVGRPATSELPVG